jgi:hypothetical protein
MKGSGDLLMGQDTSLPFQEFFSTYTLLLILIARAAIYRYGNIMILVRGLRKPHEHVLSPH